MAMPVEGGLVSPHTVADDEYMAKQLPYLQERAPVLKNVSLCMFFFFKAFFLHCTQTHTHIYIYVS